MIRHEVDEVRNKVICTEVMRLRDLTARAGRLTETRTSFALTLVLFAGTAGKEQKRLYGTASVCNFFGASSWFQSLACGWLVFSSPCVSFTWTPLGRWLAGRELKWPWPAKFQT